MASFNLSVVNSSPLISYSPPLAWFDITAANDTSVSSYFSQSYHTTATQGAQATISFNGTGLQVFGSKRSNYGAFDLQVDGKIVSTCNGSSTGNPVFQQLLCSTPQLSNGPHVAVLTNSNNAQMDIDNVVILGEMGQPGANVTVSTFDDSNPAMVYSPSTQGAWRTNTGNTFMNNSLHFTQTPGASASMQFNGAAVAVYGTVSPDHADIQVTLDEQLMPLLPGGSGGRVSSLHTKVLLFFASGLGPGQHKVSISGNPNASTGPFMDVDAIQVYTASNPALNTSSRGTASTVASTSSVALPSANVVSSATPAELPDAKVRSSPGVPKGAIIGACVGGVIVLIAIVLALLWFLRRRRGDTTTLGSRFRKSMIGSPKSPQLPMQRDPEAGYRPPGSDSIVFPLPPPATVQRSYSQHSIAPSYYGNFPDSMTQISHTRDESASSYSSITPLIPPVPSLSRPSAVARKPAPNGSGMVTNVAPSNPPGRPRRPPG